jgi:D-alanyl-D-alanine dipeptidase
MGHVACRGSWGAAHAEPSRPILERASQVILITPRALDRPDAEMRLYERDGNGKLALRGEVMAVVGGAKGFAWSYADAEGRTGKVPVKREGDLKTPMGVFALGAPFGFAEDRRPGYLRLKAGETLCVDDPASPHYGRIAPRAGLPKGTTGEDMGATPLYRRGYVVDTPVNGAKRSGSCIFLHLWRGKGKGTAGCIAMGEAAMTALQAWVKPSTVVAVLPASAARLN